jgi:hypothetical protein
MKRNNSPDYIERRSSARVPVGEEVKICEGNLFFSGTALNISDNGMFIGTKKHFPLETVSLIVMNMKDRLFKLPAKIKRSTLETGFYDGIGVELIDPPRDYLEFLNYWKR